MIINPFYPADFSCALLLLSACFACPTAFAQDKPQQGTSGAAAGSADHVRAFAFDVVSIRPHDRANSFRKIEVSRGGDEFRSIGNSLATAIEFAYFPIGMQSKDRIVNPPGWLWSAESDFVGKVSPNDLEEWHSFTQHGFVRPNPVLEAMVQTALADRCKLVVHRIPATVPGFALVVSSRGSNRKRFVEAKPNETIPDNAQEIHEDGRMVPILSRYDPDPVVHFYETSMASLTANLSEWGALVEDRTGLIGKYDFALARLSTIGDPSADWDVPALGLKLEPIKVPAENIVIDHIEYPSPN
jgi:uncharacterized protein (TIGR03435 family)